MPRGGRVQRASVASLSAPVDRASTSPAHELDVWAALRERLQLLDEVADGLDVWEVVDRRSDPAAWRPQTRADVEVVRVDWARSGPRALMSRGTAVYTLEDGEAELVALMDGGHTVADLVAKRLGDSGDLELSSVVALVELLRAVGFLTERPCDVYESLERSLYGRSKWLTTVQRSARTLSVELNGSDRLFAWLYRHGLRRVMNPVGAVASAVVALGGLVVLGFVLSSRSFHFTTQSAGWGFVLLIALNTLVIFVHEMGHAVTVVHYGRRIEGAGIRIYYGSPAFFVAAPQALMLTRSQRIFQAFAGPWFESVVGGVACVGLWLAPAGWISAALFRFVVLDYYVILLNLVPLLQLDGYWIFSDAIGVPDLRPLAFAFLRHDLWLKLRDRGRFSASEVGLGLYAVVGLAFAALSLFLASFFWRRTFGGVVSRMWHAGAFGAALLVVLAVVVAGPLLQAALQALKGLGGQAAQAWHHVQFRLQRRWRVEAAEIIDQLGAFDDLPVEALNDLAGRVRLVTFGPFQTVVRQGQPADAYYVVRRGRVSVVEDLPDGGEQRVLRQLGPGEAFGELALVRRGPRSASVVALERAELFVVDVGAFDRLLAPHLRIPEFAPSVQEAAELASVPALRSLNLQELMKLVAAGEWVTVGPGQDVVAQGEVPDGFYVLLEGRAEVLVDGERVRVLEHGSYFGELALLGAGRRTATVRSLTPIRMFRVGIEGFDSVLAKLFGSASAERPPVSVDRES